jgi:hypothetical protein
MEGFIRMFQGGLMKHLRGPLPALHFGKQVSRDPRIQNTK